MYNYGSCKSSFIILLCYLYCVVCPFYCHYHYQFRVATVASRFPFSLLGRFYYVSPVTFSPFFHKFDLFVMCVALGYSRFLDFFFIFRLAANERKKRGKKWKDLLNTVTTLSRGDNCILINIHSLQKHTQINTCKYVYLCTYVFMFVCTYVYILYKRLVKWLLRFILIANYQNNKPPLILECFTPWDFAIFRL